MAISLEKGQKISLSKEAGGALQKVFMGLGWDGIKTGGGFFSKAVAKDVDLDASCLVFNEAGELLDAIWFRKLINANQSIKHSGDNRTGDGDGDDETILVELTKLPANAKSLVFTVTSFLGQTFNEIENAYCRLVNATDGKEIARYPISGGGQHTGMIMAKIYNHNGDWKMNAIGDPCNGRTFDEMVPRIKNYV